LAIWQNDRRKIADENRDDGLTQAKSKPPVPRKARKQAVLQLVLLTGIEPVWCCHRGILSPLRLPISPQQQTGGWFGRFLIIQ
jgi:hypothetical protein